MFKDDSRQSGPEPDHDPEPGDRQPLPEAFDPWDSKLRSDFAHRRDLPWRRRGED